MSRDEILDRFFQFLARKLPTRLNYHAFIHVLAEATTGKYSYTIVGDISAMDAVARYARIHGIRGHGKDEHYDSNRYEVKE